MAEALVNVLLERLATITLDKVQEELNLVIGVEKEVKSLTRNLRAIQAVLQDAEQRQVTESSVRLWLNELNEVSYEMDEVLDEWITEVRKQQMEKQENQGENPLVATKKKEFMVDEYGETSCKMHDIVHDFLQYLTKKECLIVDFKAGDSEGMVVPDVDKVRHLTLMQLSQSELLASFRNCKHLRTLIAFDSSIDSTCLELVLQLKCLRTLNLSKSNIEEIPREMGGLIHLRYLDLSHNDLKELPNALSSLYNLQTLRLVKCSHLKKVDLARLINIRHLYVEGCEHLKLMGLSRLINLETLDTLYVHGDGELGDLKNLNQLQGCLAIKNAGRLTSESEQPNLVNKVNLLHLTLDLECRAEAEAERVSSSSGSLNDDQQRQIEEMISRYEEILRPPPGLESLSITSYIGRSLCSDWFLSFHSLRWLTLGFCFNCKFLPPLGKLPSLESLNLVHLSALEKLGVEFLGIEPGTPTSFISFPKLKQLAFNWIPALKEWEGVGDCSWEIMPRLSSLGVYECPSLKALPDFLWRTPLRKLHIRDIASDAILPNVYQREGGEEWPKISHIPEIRIGNHWIYNEEQDPKGDDIEVIPRVTSCVIC
ncbi:putative disease resistance protein RGA3 isoform X2 [Rosa rugosa]|uniref:putative disease resistance protein RGA3 isoform X2 n=1 Tax=Rosa rugosa TaxID=74645 RepID=UPI002B41381B|nr:putative disease resistance protein RGA3 isoform X2 [Rosa rugosa]